MTASPGRLRTVNYKKDFKAAAKELFKRMDGELTDFGDYTLRSFAGGSLIGRVLKEAWFSGYSPPLSFDEWVERAEPNLRELCEMGAPRGGLSMASQKPVFNSDQLEQTAAHVMRRFYARILWEQQNGDEVSVRRECDLFWHAMKALNRLSVATGESDGGADHFSIASFNNILGTAFLIESITGERPEEG